MSLREEDSQVTPAPPKKKNPSALAKRCDLAFFDVAVSAMIKEFHNSSLDCCYIQHYVGMQLAELEQIISGCDVSTSLCLVAPLVKREVCSKNSLAPHLFSSLFDTKI